MKTTFFRGGKMKRAMFCLIVLGSLFWAASTQAKPGPSQSTLLFLKIAPGARPSGMGEAFVAVSDDATATWWNPAGLGFQKDRQVTMMFVKWLPQFNMSDLYYSFLSGTYTLGEDKKRNPLGTFGGSLIFLNLGETEGRDANNNPTRNFSSYEIAASGTFGAPVSKDMAMGVGLKLAYSHLSDVGAGQERGSGTATAVAVDVGILYKMTMIHGLSLGANLSNMGPKVSYIDRAQADPLPTNLKFGFAYKAIDDGFNTLTVLTDFNKELVRRDENGKSDEFYTAIFTAWTDGDLIKSIIWNTGIEYWYSKLVGLRAGYWDDELGRIRATTFGISLKYSSYHFDFSYLSAGQNHPLTDTMRYSISVDF